MHISNQAVAKMRLAKPIAVAAILVGSFGAAGAATVCVDPGNPGACASTIQAGIDAAVAGDTVVVNKGTYYENVQVSAGKDGLTVQAQGEESKRLRPRRGVAKCRGGSLHCLGRCYGAGPHPSQRFFRGNRF